MPDENTKAEKALRALARRVQHGLAKLRPVGETHLAKVREAVRQQWAQTHPEQAPTAAANTSSLAQHPEKRKTPSQSQSPSHDQSNDHGHSH